MKRAELERWYDEGYCLEAVKENAFALRYVLREFWHLFADMLED